MSDTDNNSQNTKTSTFFSIGQGVVNAPVKIEGETAYQGYRAQTAVAAFRTETTFKDNRKLELGITQEASRLDQGGNSFSTTIDAAYRPANPVISEMTAEYTRRQIHTPGNNSSASQYALGLKTYAIPLSNTGNTSVGLSANARFGNLSPSVIEGSASLIKGKMALAAGYSHGLSNNTPDSVSGLLSYSGEKFSGEIKQSFELPKGKVSEGQRGAYGGSQTNVQARYEVSNTTALVGEFSAMYTNNKYKLDHVDAGVVHKFQRPGKEPITASIKGGVTTQFTPTTNASVNPRSLVPLIQAGVTIPLK